LSGITAITAGDPSGIGPEITVKALRSLSAAERKKIIIIGEATSLEQCGWRENLAPLLPVTAPGFKLIKSENSAYSGAVSFKAFELAVRLALKGKLSAVVTAPVSKKAWLMAGIKYKGHTEYLREASGSEPLMSFHKGAVNAALVTEHVSIKDLPGRISAGKIAEKARIFIPALRRLGFREKELLVSGLNPHCGESGELGTEEEESVKPALKILRKTGVFASGPYNSDSIWELFFKRKAAGLLFMYHDQLLTGIKNLGGRNPVVHATWGLPFFRTSPAHGTAFDISWKNSADHSGMLAAVRMALKLTRK